MNEISIASRKISREHPPFVIAEVGINHEGSLKKAMMMVAAAAKVGCECVKFQCHVIEDEMTMDAQGIIPDNAAESIWTIMERCSLNEEEERQLMERCLELGLIYLSTPFSRAAADRLETMGVAAFKIGSGECSNIPLVEHIAGFGKPIILSTGMNDMASVQRSVDTLERYKVPYALLQCTSMYPTPYDKIRLGALQELDQSFNCPIGLSDHSMGIWTSLGAVALGASILEKHYTLDKSWPGPDVPISIDSNELAQLIEGSLAIWQARGGTKEILLEEQPTINFALASVCTIRSIKKGDFFTKQNLWVKRPGTGEIPAHRYEIILGKRAACDLESGAQLKMKDIES
jgi:N-acetylneuraminate synthase